MQPHLGVEPSISVTQTTREMQRLFNSARGGSVSESFLYFDGVGAASWCEFANQEEYSKSFGDQTLFWVASEMIKNHLDDTKFNKRRIDLIGLGCGDGKRESILAQCLIDTYPELNLHCHLVDTSYPLLLEAHANLSSVFSKSRRVTFQEHQGNFHRLPQMADIFDSEQSDEVLRVGTMFGATLGNLDNELRFIRDSLQAFKSGDLFLVDVMLGFAPADHLEAIRKEDPRFTPNANTWRTGLEHWLESTLLHYRNHCPQITFENILSRATSPIPNTYTIEIHAIVKSEQQKEARFNMVRLHRYDQESFIAAFAREGWRRVGGKTFGYEKRRLWYLFMKE